MKAFALSAAVALILIPSSVFAQDGRAMVTSERTEGKISIEHGVPAWSDGFTEAMAGAKVWRLGNNSPTSITATCGIMTHDGAVAAGKYNMALSRNDKNQWDLVIYAPTGHYSAGMGGHKIHPSVSKTDAESVDKLTMKFDDKHNLHVHFGSNHTMYPMASVAMLKPVETSFARMKTKIEAMALPVKESDLDRTKVGLAKINVRGVDLHWDVHLSMNGETPVLEFVNNRGEGIAAEKSQLERRMKRWEGMMPKANEGMKGRLEKAMTEAKSTMEKLALEERYIGSFETSRKVSGKFAERTAATKTLDMTHERPEGGLVLTFGANKHNATFDINPRDFMKN